MKSNFGYCKPVEKQALTRNCLAQLSSNLRPRMVDRSQFPTSFCKMQSSELVRAAFRSAHSSVTKRSLCQLLLLKVVSESASLWNASPSASSIPFHSLAVVTEHHLTSGRTVRERVGYKSITRHRPHESQDHQLRGLPVGIAMKSKRTEDRFVWEDESQITGTADCLLWLRQLSPIQLALFLTVFTITVIALPGLFSHKPDSF